MVMCLRQLYIAWFIRTLAQCVDAVDAVVFVVNIVQERHGHSPA